MTSTASSLAGLPAPIPMGNLQIQHTAFSLDDYIGSPKGWLRSQMGDGTYTALSRAGIETVHRLQIPEKRAGMEEFPDDLLVDPAGRVLCATRCFNDPLPQAPGHSSSSPVAAVRKKFAPTPAFSPATEVEPSTGLLAAEGRLLQGRGGKSIPVAEWPTVKFLLDHVLQADSGQVSRAYSSIVSLAHDPALLQARDPGHHLSLQLQ